MHSWIKIIEIHNTLMNKNNMNYIDDLCLENT